MRLLTEDAWISCKHLLGRVQIEASQNWVTIAGRRVLVDNDPEAKTIAGCPNVGPTIKPCLKTLNVQTGYSTFVRIDGRPVCLDTVSGFTDGTPPGVVRYVVREAGQDFVSGDS